MLTQPLSLSLSGLRSSSHCKQQSEAINPRRRRNGHPQSQILHSSRIILQTRQKRIGVGKVLPCHLQHGVCSGRRGERGGEHGVEGGIDEYDCLFVFERVWERSEGYDGTCQRGYQTGQNRGMQRYHQGLPQG